MSKGKPPGPKPRSTAEMVYANPPPLFKCRKCYARLPTKKNFRIIRSKGRAPAYDTMCKECRREDSRKRSRKSYKAARKIATQLTQEQSDILERGLTTLLNKNDPDQIINEVNKLARRLGGWDNFAKTWENAYKNAQKQPRKNANRPWRMLESLFRMACAADAHRRDVTIERTRKMSTKKLMMQAVHDKPELAAQVLRDLGYVVEKGEDDEP